MVNIEKCYLCGSTKFNKRSGSVRDREELQYLESALPNRRLLDFGCGTGGFLLKAQELAATVHSVEPEICLRNGDEITSATMHHRFRPSLPDLKSQKS